MNLRHCRQVVIFRTPALLEPPSSTKGTVEKLLGVIKPLLLGGEKMSASFCLGEVNITLFFFAKLVILIQNYVWGVKIPKTFIFKEAAGRNRVCIRSNTPRALKPTGTMKCTY